MLLLAANAMAGLVRGGAQREATRGRGCAVHDDDGAGA
jgi:hypothetical protein